jgi:CheY-like chemotaxis protein
MTTTVNQANPTVLVVDDDPIVLKLLSTGLARSGFSVDTVGSGEAALERLKTKVADVIATDMRMPGMSGLELIEALRNAGNQTPVVVITSAADKNTTLKALHLGAFDLIAKPFQASVISRLLVDATKVAQSCRRLRASGATPHGNAALLQEVQWALALGAPVSGLGPSGTDPRASEILAETDPFKQFVATALYSLHAKRRSLDDLLGFHERAWDLGNLVRAWHVVRRTAQALGLERVAGIADTVEGYFALLRLTPETLSGEIVACLKGIHETFGKAMTGMQAAGNAGGGDLGAVEEAVKRLEKNVQRAEQRAS